MNIWFNYGLIQYITILCNLLVRRQRASLEENTLCTLKDAGPTTCSIVSDYNEVMVSFRFLAICISQVNGCGERVCLL